MDYYLKTILLLNVLNVFVRGFF